jgi:hypothetical protein
MSAAKPLVLLTTWAQHILGPDVERVDAWLFAGHPADQGSGIYGLFDGDRLIYIGKAALLATRIQQHQTAMKYARGQDYTAYACIAVPEDICGHVEVAHIHALQPPNNRQYKPGRWVSHDPMVGLVKQAWRR